MTTVVMSVEGVLVDMPQSDTVLNYEATDVGRETFNLLKPSARIILLSTDPYEDRIKQWLIRERMTGFSMVYNRPIDSPVNPRQWRIDKMTDMIGVGHRIGYYVDSDPFTIAQAMDVGITGLFLGVPHTYPGQDKGPQEPAPWYALVRKVDEHNAIRAERAQQESEHAAT